MARIRLHNGNLHLSTPISDIELARSIPQRRWLASSKVWSCRPSLANMSYIAEHWPHAEWDQDAWYLFEQAKQGETARSQVAVANLDASKIDVSSIDAEIAKGLFKLPVPWDHQKRALLLGRDLPYFAYIMDQGTGKTRTVLDDAAHNWRKKRIDFLIVFNKNSVKTNWCTWEVNGPDPDAVDRHLPDDVPRFKGVWQSDANAGERRHWANFYEHSLRDNRQLGILSINYEAILMDRCYEQLEAICKKRKAMIVCDESTAIGAPGSDRTKTITKLRKLCKVARICTGTPIIKSPLKAFSQFGFLSEDILGFGSFYAFKHHFCIMGGFQGRQVLKYVHLDELSDKIASCSYRVLKKDCLDLPPKVYQKRRLYMTKEQNRVYHDMRETMLAEAKGQQAVAMIQLTQMQKLQQITGGYFTDDKKQVCEIIPPSKNPKMKEVLGIMEEAGDQKVIVWCAWRHEIEALATLLRKEGYRVAEFHGGISERDRLQVRRDMAHGKYDVLLGTPPAGGIGIDEFKIASLVIYFSNSFDTEARVQSEDRTHRGGSEIHEAITYIDLIVPNTVDVKLVRTLRSNVSVSAEVMRDGIREWI